MKSHISNDSAILKSTHTSKGSADETSSAKLKLKIGFHYRQAIGELMLAGARCIIDALFPKILLSPHNTNPVECHHTAVKLVYRYLRSNIDYGLHFLRITPDFALLATKLLL